MDQESQDWSFLVGKDGAEAVEIIKEKTGLKDGHTLPSNAVVTADYRTDRIRVYVDEQGKVASAPYVG